MRINRFWYAIAVALVLAGEVRLPAQAEDRLLYGGFSSGLWDDPAAAAGVRLSVGLSVTHARPEFTAHAALGVSGGYYSLELMRTLWTEPRLWDDVAICLGIYERPGLAGQEPQFGLGWVAGKITPKSLRQEDPVALRFGMTWLANGDSIFRLDLDFLRL